MAVDERLKWLEVRISSSLRPRNEDLKNMFLNDENRLVFHEFINNEDVRRLFVYIRPPKQIIASLIPPQALHSKSIFFLKAEGAKLTKDNIGDEVSYLDCSSVPLEHLQLLVREVYLPLLCTDQTHASASGVSADKLMDILHRLMAAVEVTQGHVQGKIVLPLPSIEVLADAAANPNRRGAVLHVLESTVIGWIKQIKGILKHDPIHDLYRQYGPHPGPIDELAMWHSRLEKLHSINEQLDSPVAKDILLNLEEANSTYAHSFQGVRKEIAKALQETNEILSFLKTLHPWFQQLHDTVDPKQMLKLFAPLVHTVLLVWGHSRYYHQEDKFQNLLGLLSNEVVHRAMAMVGEDVLREPLESYSKLKEALRVCAAYRGTYLDYKDKADVLNQNNVAENAEKMIMRPSGDIWSTKLYGPHAYTPRYGLKSQDHGGSMESLGDEELFLDSPWPTRNAPCFDLLNSFMERCNDVLELVQTTRHFRLLESAAEVGGAGTQSLDALVREIHGNYARAMDDFFHSVHDVLSVDGTQAFEKAFFTFRTVVKDLEKKLAGILRLSFQQCPTIGAQLRLLEVFEGISGRELVQANLKDKDHRLVRSFTEELIQVRTLFQLNERKPPLHKNMPPVVSKMYWVFALKQRITGPMEKMKFVSPHSLSGDAGWQLRDAYTEAVGDLERYETKTVTDWQQSITAELTARLKQPLLVADEYDEEVEVRPQVVHVNLDPKLLLLLKEIRYLAQEPFYIKLPAPARELLRNTNSYELRVTATRLETIVSKYNTVMKTITDFEKPLFERKLAKIDQLFEQGLYHYTWKTEESADFIEQATALVCLDVHQNLDIVQTNCHEIAETTISWSKDVMDVFAARDAKKSYDMKQLSTWQDELNEDHEHCVVPCGTKIHGYLDCIFTAVEISQASPAWEDYVDYIDAIVLDGLKQATLTSLRSMHNQIVQCNLTEGDDIVPILTIRLELLENQIAFRPPLDQSSSDASVQETVDRWLESYLARGSLVKMLGPKGSYRDYIEADVEVQQLIDQIQKLVGENGEECKKLYELFYEYDFLWMQDVNQTFNDFLQGKVSPNPLRTAEKSQAGRLRDIASARSTVSRASSAKSSIEEAGLMGTAEKTFLTPKKAEEIERKVPSIDEFDAEIDIYRKARDDVIAFQDHQDVGWLRVDMKPIKQVLTTYASKWMWTFTKYLSDQVTSMLETLDQFLRRIEPEIESITGEERDTASFMKMMRLFNEVSAQQNEMDGKFAAMHRTVLLLKKYNQKLPDSTQQLFVLAPGRWNSLKTKVSLAKQRLGPRIQEESERITRDLAAFGERVMILQTELDASIVFGRDCSIGDAWEAIDKFVRRLTILENEAQDLIELQDLLETSVVNFSILPQCHHDLDNLKEVWETVRIIEEQQSDWKRHRWQKMNTKFLREETNKQLDTVKMLPEDVFTWDIYMGLHESITTIQACLPLIDDLSNPAMRTRHWKHIVRVTGGAIQIDNDTLKRLTLGELLSLGLQKHVDDVRAIVNRAVKDLSIEQSLKTYEEVWLSKVFELRSHVRSKIHPNAAVQTKEDGQAANPDTQSELSGSNVDHPPAAGTLASRQTRTASRISNQSTYSKTRRASVGSLPGSLINLDGDTANVYLLTTIDPIFEELESHQVTLQTMQGSSAAGSFLDEVMKWQKRLQTIEAVLTTWLEVQEKWVELEEIYSGADIKTSLSRDASLFAAVDRDFRLLMKATERNPNVLQCCSRKNILSILEKMNANLEHCRRSLLNHLERRRQRFPRFYFLSMEDVLHVVCNGYDLNQVNLYINKLFENVGSLVFEDLEDHERCNFQIIGVQSHLGERLPFKGPIMCEGHIEGWLPSFLTNVKSALQLQLALALGIEKPPPRHREIHSAGARRVSVPSREKPAGKGAKVDKSGSRSNSRQASRQSKRESQSDLKPEQTKPERQEGDGRSMTLDHISEVVYLVTRIQMSTQIEEVLKAVDGGNRDALKAGINKINSSLQATVVMLKGIEDEKEKQARRERERRSDSEALSHSQREGKDKSESLSETASHLGKTSLRGSRYDLTAGIEQPPQSPIPEEGSSHHEGEDGMREAPVEPSTGEPVDTMNLNMMDLFVKKEEEVQEEEIDMSDLKLMLFPSQIQKISNLIALLAHYRDLFERFIVQMEQSNTGMADCFDWRMQLKYVFKEDRSILVQCLDASIDYGFEYMGSCHHEVITPLTEKAFLSLTQAVKVHMGGLCMGPAASGKLETVHEMSRCLGQPLYTFNCTTAVDSFMLNDIFKGFAATGSWICFNNINLIEPTVISILAQLLTLVLDALRAGKQTINLQNEELTLNPNGACFGLIDSSIPATPGVPDKLLIFNSAVAHLPNNLLNQFRVVSLVKPDLKLIIEVMLISQGFSRAQEAARKTSNLYDMCSKLVATNSPIVDGMKLGTDANEGSHGWSLQTLKYVAFEAGAILDGMVCLEMAAEEEHLEGEPLPEDVEPEKHEKEQQEKQEKEKAPKPNHINIPAKYNKNEEEALVTALRNTFMPRLPAKDASVFSTLVADLWPEVQIPMVFDGISISEKLQSIEELDEEMSRSGSKMGSKPGSRMKGSKSMGDSYKESIPLNTPVVGMQSVMVGRYSAIINQNEKQPLEDIFDAIAVATSDLGLMPGRSFQARVGQLAQLNVAHQTIIVVGPPGCGKSECIKTFAVAERERGKTISIQTIFTKAVESEELLGYVDPYTKEWKDGLLPTMLRKFCIQPATVNYDLNTKPVMKILMLDGDLDPNQMELMENVMHNDGSIVLGNNERVNMITDNLRFIWELESLSDISPSTLANVGVLAMSTEDVGWKLMLTQWLDQRPDSDKELIKGFCDTYIGKVMDYLAQCTSPPMTGRSAATGPHYKRVIQHTEKNMIDTFTALFGTLVGQYNDLTDVEYERYFNFACIWAFAGTLEMEYRESFNHWWRQEFEQHIDYPEDGTVFDYMVDSESHEFCKWADSIPQYSGTPHMGIPWEAFVHTNSTEQIYHLLGLLSDVGKPVMLVGRNGCGKTSVVADRIRTVYSGEVAEVLALTINTNRFTNARLLYQRLDDRLEWKHGRTYVPKGNKRLMCLVDDLNLAQVDKYGFQSAVELVRQHIDDGGFYAPDNHCWRYVKNVTYVTTINPSPSASVPKLSQRLLRHFAIFGCPYPSSQESLHIFTTLMYTHFITPEMSSTVTISASTAHHLGINDEKVQNVIKEEEEALKELINSIVRVNLELQDRMRSMFLPTAQRCHYIFTMRDLGNIFRNLCLSLRPGCSKDNLLLLWQHECWWVYGQRMVDDVDRDRFKQAFQTAVRKEFTSEEMIQLITKRKAPLFSNLIEQDSGIVTAGNVIARSDITAEEAKTDMYQASPDEKRTRHLMEHGVEEYNKTQPRIKLALYKNVVEHVCRLARTIAAPHEVAHIVLIAEGDPGRCSTMVKLAAHLSGFHVFQINPSPISSPIEYNLDVFRADLVAAYTRSGVKSEKTLFLVREEELLDEDFLVYIEEFIMSASISHLFSYEEQTTIINSIRTEVTQAGLTYTREVAWDFFLKTVRNNFRICLIASSGGPKFQKRCREYPALVKNCNFYYFPHWSRQQLVEHAAHHLKEMNWMSRIQKENIAHMLASMHIAIRSQDGQEKDSGEYRHITNTTYERFVERFISVANNCYKDVHSTHDMVCKALEQIQKENSLAAKLQKQLEHEKIVLEERKAGTIRILSQIGQDTAITEQQVKIVKSQMEKIHKLKKLLPEYQVAYERAVYKASAIVGDTKKVVQNMDMDSLQDLRAMQKPIIDIEDLMAAIIMILKSPSADLTWQKGAKRQMANLERFTEELQSFDDMVLPEPTLNLVEPYLKKSSFDPETIERKTSNAACGSLCRWVRGVVRYHRMMISKVKPLHNKVEQTTQAVDNAEQKMNQLENKRKALDIRLADLAQGFEDATIDKNDQEEKTVKMDKMLETAARLRKILKSEHLRCQQIHDCVKNRENAIPGGCSIAAAFATYLGPYHYNFRRLMLTVHWPNCLRERGVPLVIDSVDHLRGRVIDFSVDGLKTAAGATGLPAIDEVDEYLAEGGSQLGQPEVEVEAATEDDGTEKGTAENGEETQETQPEEQRPSSPKTNETPLDQQGAQSADQTDQTHDQMGSNLERIQEERSEFAHGTEISESESTGSSIPMITAAQYNLYVRSVVKLLVGEKTLYEWIKKDLGPRQLENAAIAFTSWQTPPILVDPYGEGVTWLSWLSRTMNKKKMIKLDADTRTHTVSKRVVQKILPQNNSTRQHTKSKFTSRADPTVIVAIEKSIMKGRPVLLENCSEDIDSMLMPLIHHINTAIENDPNEEPRMIRFCGRRILAHPEFRLYLSSPNPKPQFSPHVASTTTLINYGMSGETLVEDLLTRAFARVRPELFKERKLALKNIHRQREVLHKIMEYSKRDIVGHSEIWDEREVEFISDAQQKKVTMAQKLHETQLFLEELDMLKDELFPIARRGAMLYSVVRSLSAVQREYQFTLPYFMALFDKAVGDAFPDEYYDDSDADEDFEDDESSVPEGRLPRGTSTSTRSRHSQRASSSGTHKQAVSGDGGMSDRSREKDSTAAGIADVDASSRGRSSRAGDDFEGEDLNQNNNNNNELEEGEDVNDDGDKLPVWDLPDIPDLPTEGVDYSVMEAEKVRQIVDSLTNTVYQNIKQSLYEEHALLFATMLCLNMQVESGEEFSDEELSLLLQGNPGLGMQLTLADFECESPDPDWLPKDKWEDVLALSVLPGPLDSICVHIAENSDEWKAWYSSGEPENEPIPIEKDRKEGEKEKEPAAEKTGDPEGSLPGSPLPPVSAFHKLLVLRMTRHDRLPSAMAQYIDDHFGETLSKLSTPSFDEIRSTMGSHSHGLLVLLPPSVATTEQHPISSLKMAEHPVETIKNLALTKGITVEHVVMGEGCEVVVENKLDQAEKQDGWLIIEDLHLCPESFHKELKHHLSRVSKTLNAMDEEGQPKKSNFCVWITTEPSTKMPSTLLQQLHKLSWNNVTPQLLDPPKEGSTEEGSESKQKFSFGSLKNLLKTAIAHVFNIVPHEKWEKIKDLPQLAKNIIFGIGIIQGALTARQMLGSLGLSQWAPFSKTQIIQAMDLVVMETERQSNSEPSLDELMSSVAAHAYGNTVVNEWDQNYIRSLVKQVLHQLKANKDKILLGTIEVFIPEPSVDPSEYGKWVLEKDTAISEEDTLQALSMHGSIEKYFNEASGLEFLDQLDKLYETQNMDVSVEPAKKGIDITKLRAALDMCVEQIPPLLELGDMPNNKTYNFPYHHPSLISLASVSSTLMPESIGHVLLQECQWLNTLLCHVRQTTHEIQQSLLGGPDNFSPRLHAAALCLQDEHVPVTWIHPNCQPSTHTLESWLVDLKQRFKQFQHWVKSGMVPTYDKDGKITNSGIARGQLSVLWLGGLVNPQALFTALRQEKAVLAKTEINEVSLLCDVADSFEAENMSIQDEGGLFVRDFFLQGASWDMENDCLADPVSHLHVLPAVYIRPVLNSDIKQDLKEGMVKYNCPVFMNQARQVSGLELPLNSKVPVEEESWTLRGAAIILDPGVPEDIHKKPRKHAAMKAVMFRPLEYGSHRSLSTRQAHTAELFEGMESQMESRRSHLSQHSYHSQMSYKPMTPKASPLPPGLQLTREAVRLDEEPEQNGGQSPRLDSKKADFKGSKESLGGKSQASQHSLVQETDQNKTDNIMGNGEPRPGSQQSQRSDGSRSKISQARLNLGLGNRPPSQQSTGQRSRHSSNQSRQSGGLISPGRQSVGGSQGRQSVGGVSAGRQSVGGASDGRQSVGKQSGGRQSVEGLSEGRQSVGGQSTKSHKSQASQKSQVSQKSQASQKSQISQKSQTSQKSQMSQKSLGHDSQASKGSKSSLIGTQDQTKPGSKESDRPAPDYEPQF